MTSIYSSASIISLRQLVIPVVVVGAIAIAAGIWQGHEAYCPRPQICEQPGLPDDHDHQRGPHGPTDDRVTATAPSTITPSNTVAK